MADSLGGGVSGASVRLALSQGPCRRPSDTVKTVCKAHLKRRQAMFEGAPIVPCKPTAGRMTMIL